MRAGEPLMDGSSNPHDILKGARRRALAEITWWTDAGGLSSRA